MKKKGAEEGMGKGQREEGREKRQSWGLVGHHPRGRHYCPILANRILALLIVF